MNYPLISEYIEAIRSAEDNFNELANLRPVLVDDEQPVMTSGNFAVVFKMKDVETGKFYALKCFTKEQEGRSEAYHQIAEELKNVESPYLTSIRYFDKELFVDTDQSTETEFPVLLMDWVEGKTLDKYLRENLDDKYALEMLVYRFSQLAQWLIPQPFAHGDLKPDNILVRIDGTLTLVDYDGMYVPAMKGQKARELGSPDFRHPLRKEEDFDEHIDDFPLVSILLSIKAVSINPQLLEEYGASDRLLLSEEDNRNIGECGLFRKLFPNSDSEINILISAYIIVLNARSLNSKYVDLINISQPTVNGVAITQELIDIGIDMALLRLRGNNKITYEDFKKIMIDSVGQSIEPLLHHIFTNAFKFFQLMEHARDLSTIGVGFDWHGIDGFYTDDGKRLLKFSSNVNTENYRIKEGTEVICDFAFSYNLHYLRSVYIPSSVIKIGENPFLGCLNLTIICDSPLYRVKDGLLYDRLFDRLIASINSAEDTIEVHSNVSCIGAYSFWACPVKKIKLPNSIRVIEHCAFMSSGIEKIFIPQNVEKIGSWAFSGCEMSEIFISSKCCSIEQDAFEGCNRLSFIFVLKENFEYYKKILLGYAEVLFWIEMAGDSVPAEDIIGDMHGNLFYYPSMTPIC